MDYNAINPKAFSNTDTLKSVMGETIPDTFNRSVGINPQANIDPLTGIPIINQATQPVQPPVGVQMPATPIYDLNNY